MNQITKKKSKGFLAILLTLIMALGLVISVSAEGTDGESVYDAERKGSITVSLEKKNGEEKYNNVRLQLYKVGSVNTKKNYLSYELDDSLKEIEELKALDLNELTTAEASREASDLLASVIKTSRLKPTDAITNSDGIAEFQNLDQGMYLIAENGVNAYGNMEPWLVSVPYMDDGKTWIYDVKTTPKIEDYYNYSGQIQVTKKIKYQLDDGTVIDLNTKDDSFDVGIFLDEEGTIPYTNNNIKTIHVQNGNSSTVTFDNLPTGIYYIYEMDGDQIVKDNGRVGKKVETGTEFKYVEWNCVYGDMNNTDTEVLSNRIDLNVEENPVNNVTINNVYDSLPDQYYVAAALSINKTVLVNDQVDTVNDTFYAGIFQVDKDGNETLYDVVELQQNSTVITEVPLSGENGIEDTTYVIKETDVNGVPVDKDTFGYIVSGEKDITFTTRSLNGTIGLINESIEQQSNEEPSDDQAYNEENTTTKETTDSSDTTNTRTTTKTKKTGDQNPIALYLGILVAAVVIAGIVLVRKKKDNKHSA